MLHRVLELVSDCSSSLAMVVLRRKLKPSLISPSDPLPGKDDEGSLSPDSDTLLDQTNTGSHTLRAHNDTVQAAAATSTTEALMKSPVKVGQDGQLEVPLFDTMEEFEAALPQTVSVLEGPFGSRVYLIGSAHFSEESMNDVSFVIRNVRPDFVMVELCQSRSHIMLMDEQQLLHEATDLNMGKLRSIYQTNGINSIFYILLLSMSSKLTKDLGRAPGCEFRRAFSEAKLIRGCTIHLGDRPIGVTINRMLRSLSIWDTMKLVWRLLTADDKITAEEVEECKQQSLLERCMAEMAADFPHFDELFVKERDMYMAYSLQNAAMPVADENGMPRAVRVVGVVGIGHAAGIKKNWGKVSRQQVERIMTIPEPQLSKRILKATLKYGFYGLICYGAFKIIRPRLPAKLL